jgi:Ca-activated chloride channel homolog
MRCSVAVLLLASCARTAASQVPASDAPAVEAFRVSVDVDLVVLHAAVRDRKGRTVPELRESDFEVYEDGVRQSIRTFKREDVPVTVGLVVDHSGSMSRKLAGVMSAARSFVQSSNPEDEMFVVNFNEKVTLGLKAGVLFTSSADELGAAILNAPVTGQTALYDAVGEALQRLKSAGRDKQVLIVISDGADNASTLRLSELLLQVRQSSALVYTIGIFDSADPDRNPRVLRRLAGNTGGEAFFPDELNPVSAVCERIARDIRNQYTIGYLSTSADRPGTYRSIRVGVPRSGKGKLSVRTRSGYVR